MLTNQDILQIEQRGSIEAKVLEQLANFESGFPFMDIRKPTTVGDGINKLTDEEVQEYISLYETEKEKLEVLKFVPASGAASRMFKALFEFAAQSASEQAAEIANNKAIGTFIDQIESFAFFQDLEACLKGQTGKSIAELKAEKAFGTIINGLLEEDGLCYGQLPKGLLKFHAYAEGARTPIDEHLVEGANYGASNGVVKIHFTVSPEHRERFEAHVQQAIPAYEAQYGIKYEISYSEQKPSTDTVAADMDNQPFREDGKLLFRPGGHGALIENLNDLDADLILIKNIDNVVTDRLKDTTYTYKKVLGGVAIKLNQEICAYTKALKSESITDAQIDAAADFVEKSLCTVPPTPIADLNKADKLAYLLTKLQRPVRVCGMVKNDGDTGGGPFWAINPDGSISPQVVETSQIDVNDPSKKTMLSGATHFNPVDIACITKDCEGKKYQLPDFVDPKAGFISQKSKMGRDLKAQELPGLWNGAMSNWNTVFVEVPLITFNPVKMVNDLLLDQHQ